MKNLENNIKVLLEKNKSFLDKEDEKVVVEFESWQGETCEGYLYNIKTGKIEESHPCGVSADLIKDYPKTSEYFDVSNVDGDYLFDSEFQLIIFQCILED